MRKDSIIQPHPLDRDEYAAPEMEVITLMASNIVCTSINPLQDNNEYNDLV